MEHQGGGGDPRVVRPEFSAFTALAGKFAQEGDKTLEHEMPVLDT
jgi:hypothetical protein